MICVDYCVDMFYVCINTFLSNRNISKYKSKYFIKLTVQKINISR